MTKAEYLEFLKVPVGQRDLGKCHEADALIKRLAIEEFKKHLVGIPEPIARLARDMVHYHYGSIEVDDVLMELKCYPEWIDGEKG